MRFGKFSRHKHLNDAIVAGILAAILCVLGLMLLLNIFEKKQEARHHFLPSVQLTESDEDAAKWGQNFPLQYESYLKTVDQVRTKYGGSEAIPRTPTASDPRSIVSQSRIEEDPRLKQIWAGYAFSKDFREERGHAFMLVDQLFTERQQFVPQPGACIQCHSSAVTAMRKLGNGDMKAGFDALNAMPYGRLDRESDAAAGAAVSRPGEACDSHLSQRRAVARGYVRPQARAREARREEPSDREPADRAEDRCGVSLAVSLSEAWGVGDRDQRVVSARGEIGG
jgi:formate-dependent nitrite reductase cytochrome c552 subunit